MRRVSAIACLALLGALLSAAGPAAGAAPTAPYEVTERSATLTAADRDAGYPTRPEAIWQLSRARYFFDLAEDTFTAQATLDTVAPNGVERTVELAVGAGGVETCTLGGPRLTTVLVGNAQSADQSGPLPAGWADATCAVVTLRDGDTVVDVLTGRITNHVPRIVLSRPTLLDSKRLALVRGAWTKLDVTVANRGRGDAGRVTVTGSGPGLRVRPVRSSLAEGADGKVQVLVKLVGKRQRTRLRLVARHHEFSAVKTATVRRVAKPAAAPSGRYRTRDGNVRFRVRQGRVVGMRVRAESFCYIPIEDRSRRAADDPFEYYDYYDVPTVRIGRDGIVNRTWRSAGKKITLAFRADGRWLRRGHFTQETTTGSTYCTAMHRFSARRVGP